MIAKCPNWWQHGLPCQASQFPRVVLWRGRRQNVKLHASTFTHPVQSLLCKIIGFLINFCIITEHINECIGCIGPEKSVYHLTYLWATRFGLNLDNRWDPIHGTLRSATIKMISAPKPIGLPVNRILQRRPILTPRPKPKHGILVWLTVAYLNIERQGLRSAAYFFLDTAEGSISKEFVCGV